MQNLTNNFTTRVFCGIVLSHDADVAYMCDQEAVGDLQGDDGNGNLFEVSVCKDHLAIVSEKLTNQFSI